MVDKVRISLGRKVVEREPIVAWRCWDVTMPIEWHSASSVRDEWKRAVEAGEDSASMLRAIESLSSPMLVPWSHSTKRSWLPHEAIRASCSIHPDPPGERCGCGYWAFKERELLHAHIPGRPEVWGEVYLWGRVVEHRDGYRAEYAYPKSLTGRSADKLAALYGVEHVPEPKVEPPEGGEADLYRTTDPSTLMALAYQHKLAQQQQLIWGKGGWELMTTQTSSTSDYTLAACTCSRCRPKP